jgi:hypothetical protein
MIYNDDFSLKDMLYDIGFGSYVIDPCQKVSKNTSQTDYPDRITRAVSSDADARLLV